MKYSLVRFRSCLYLLLSYESFKSMMARFFLFSFCINFHVCAIILNELKCYSAPRGGPAGLPQRRPHQRGGRRGGGSGGRRGKERSQPKSAEELDAELEKYHAESMQTN